MGGGKHPNTLLTGVSKLRVYKPAAARGHLCPHWERLAENKAKHGRNLSQEASKGNHFKGPSISLDSTVSEYALAQDISVI